MGTIVCLLVGVLLYPLIFLVMPIDKGMGLGWTCLGLEIYKKIRDRR